MDLKVVRQHQAFKSVKEMDLHVRGYLQQHKRKLSKGNISVLQFIWRHSVKYPGVSFAKIPTIVKKTGLSKSSVIRTINRLEETGLLKRVATKKPNGQQGSNLLVIQPQDPSTLLENDTLPETPSATPPSPPESSPVNDVSTNFNKETEDKPRVAKKICKEVHKEIPVLDPTFLPSYIPKPFISISAPFLAIEEIEQAWKSVSLAYRKVKLKHLMETYMELILDTLKKAIYAYKSGKVNKSLNGYFYGGILQVFTQQVRREVMESPDNLYYNWLQS